MSWRFCILVVAMFVRGAFAAGLVVPQGGITLGEVQPGEAIEKTVVIGNDAERAITVSRVKACCGGEATVDPMSVPAKGEAKLTLRMKAQIPGEIAKAVTLYCDDPYQPIVEVPVTGRVVETDEVKMMSGATVAAIVAAGVVDGFNPCSFAIMISLAGILAIGGRRRRARILGGLSFCFGSFVTYMLMGLGLMRALRALEGLRIAYDVVTLFMALSLFVLSFLSFRDALRFRRIPVFSVVTLKLPEGVKNTIRRVALVGWKGPAVVLAGLGCGFVITLLDALCTGQVYVPVLALIAREPGAWRAFALLVIYNLAFIAPLVAVFVLASKTTDAFQMAKWSSRNVIPAKIALGVVFAVLGTVFFVRVGGRLADLVFAHEAPPPPAAVAPGAPRVLVSSRSPSPRDRSRATSAPASVIAVICGNDDPTADRYEARNDTLRSIARCRDLVSDDVAALMLYVRTPDARLRPERDAALKNDVLNLLRNQRTPPVGLAEMLLEMSLDGGADPTLVDYAYQHLGALQHDVGDAELQGRIRAAFVCAARDIRRPYAGTALFALADARRITREDEDRLRDIALGLLDPVAHPAARISALQLVGQRRYREALPRVREILSGSRRDIATDMAALGALGAIGESADADLVRTAFERGGLRLQPAAEAAIASISGRREGGVE